MYNEQKELHCRFTAVLQCSGRRKVIFYIGSEKIRSCHCKKLQCAYCKFTVWLLYSHCIPFVKAICFASISEPVPTVNLQCSGSAHCKFTMRGPGSIVNLQWYHCKTCKISQLSTVKSTAKKHYTILQWVHCKFTVCHCKFTVAHCKSTDKRRYIANFTVKFAKNARFYNTSL